MPFRRETIEAICELVDAGRDPGKYHAACCRLRDALRTMNHRIPIEWREKYQRERSLEELRRDAVVAFDQISSLKLKVWILTAVVTAEGAVIGWLASALLTCMN